MSAPLYTSEEIDAIAGWLVDDLSASQIAGKLSDLRRSPVSRCAIIGVVHRNKRLKEIGFSRGGTHGMGGGFEHASPKQNLRAGNIRGKKEGRAFDPGLPEVRARQVGDGISPHVYDGTARHVELHEPKRMECHWPVNHAAPGEPHLFCGLPTDIDAVYCPHHQRRASGRGTESERAAPRVLERQG